MTSVSPADTARIGRCEARDKHPVAATSLCAALARRSVGRRSFPDFARMAHRAIVAPQRFAFHDLMVVQRSAAGKLYQRLWLGLSRSFRHSPCIA
jgi:hypothetical protein